ncbi:olfactory receptor 14J1-like [Caloenas nicobarica]|uniref:olfactory receptor 14J1-like n=1 Tax=Caloenas nicobarica TaxID=187106 RepID=UPI0032B80B57
MTPIYRKGRKEDLGTYRSVNLTSVLGKVVEQMILANITQHLQENHVIRPSQNGLVKGRSCLTNLISYYNKVTQLVEEGKTVDVLHLDFSKAFDTLHYGTLLGSRACVHMAAAAWATGFLSALLHTANTFSLPLCKGNALDQFFCEIPQILKLSCSDAYLREAGLLVVSLCLSFGCFVFIVLSYVQILRAVLRIPSEQGRHKAFSTCLPHLAVVSLFVSTAFFSHLKPPSISSPSLDLVVSILYSVVPPSMGRHRRPGPTVVAPAVPWATAPTVGQRPHQTQHPPS